MNDCLFCRIIAGEIPSAKVFEDELCYAFKDINPQAKVHVLVIPKKHISSLNSASPADQALLGALMLRVKDIAETLNIAKSGYRVVTNIGGHACQSVEHLHLHLLGGEQLKGEMG